MLPHSKESKTNVQPKNRFRRICLKELSFQTIDIIKSKSETCTVSLPLKVSKIFKLVSSQVLSGNFTGIYSNTQTRPRHLTSILTKITQPHKQTSVPSLSHACSAQHACVTQASPGQQKQRDLQAEPLHAVVQHIVNLHPILEPRTQKRSCLKVVPVPTERLFQNFFLRDSSCIAQAACGFCNAI